MSMLFVLVLPAPAYGQGHNMTRQRHIAIGGNHEYAYRVSFAPDCHLERVCGGKRRQTSRNFCRLNPKDLAYAKIPSWYSEGGIAVHGITYTRVHLHL